MLKIKHNCFFILSVLILSFIPLFSMESSGADHVEFHTGKFSSVSHIDHFERFFKKLPEHIQSSIVERASEFFTSSAKSNYDTIFEFGLERYQGKARVGMRLSNYSEEIVKRGPDLELISRTVPGDNSIVIDFDLDEPNILIVFPNTKSNQKINSPGISDKSFSTQWMLDDLKESGHNNLDWRDCQKRDMIFSDTEIGIEWFTTELLESNSIPELENAIEKATRLLSDVDTKNHDGNLNVRRSVRNEFDSFEALDDTSFINESSAKKVCSEKLGFLGSIGRKVGRALGSVYDAFAANSKNKFALRDGLIYNRELLNKRYSELLQQQFKRVFKKGASVPVEKVSSVVEAAVLNIDETVLSDLNLEQEADTPDDVKNSVDSFSTKNIVFSGNTESSSRGIVGKVLDFCRNPKVVQAVDNAMQAGIRNVLLDEDLDYAIKETVDELIETFKEPDLSSAFEKEYIDPYRQESMLLSDDRVEFKNFVKNKIIFTEKKLNSFSDQCNNSDIDRYEYPLVYFHNEYSKEICAVSRLGLDLAKDYSNSNQLKMANNITDFSSSLINATKATKKFLKLVGTGALQGIEKYKDPVQVVKDFGEGFVNLAIGLGKTVIKMAEFDYLCDKDPEMAARMAQDFFSSTEKKINNIVDNFSHFPYEEKVVFVSKTLAECVVDGAVSGGEIRFDSKTAQFFKAIPNLVEKEASVAKLATRLLRDKVVNFKEALTPLTNAVMETTEFVKIVGTNGIKLSKASLEIVSKNKGIVAAEGCISKAVSKVIERTKDNFNIDVNSESNPSFYDSDIGDTQNYKSLILEYDHDNNLVQIVQRQIDLLENEFENGSKKRVIIYKERVDAIIQALQNPNEQIKQAYNFDNNIREYIKYYNLNLGRLNYLEGNSIEQNIHKEVVNVIKDTSNIISGFIDRLNTSNMAQVIFNASDIALDLKDNNSYEKAYSLLDVIHGVYDIGKDTLFAAGKGISNFSDTTRNGIDFLLDASKEDLINGVFDVAKGLYFLTRQASSEMYSLNSQNLNNFYKTYNLDSNNNFDFPNYLDYFVAKTHYGQRDGPFPEFQNWKNLTEEKFKELKIKREDYWDKLKTNPKEFYLDGVTDSIALILDFGLIDIAVGKVANLGKTFSNIFEAELEFLADNTKTIPATSAGVIDIEAVESINTQAPVLSAVKMTEELNHSAVKYGSKVVDNALKVIEKNPKLLSLENSLADTVDLVALNEVCQVSSGVGKALKKDIPNSVYYKLDNATKKKIVSKTVYNKNGLPKFREDYNIGDGSYTPHYSKKLERFLNEGHRHIFEYNEYGPLKPKIVPLD